MPPSVGETAKGVGVLFDGALEGSADDGVDEGGAVAVGDAFGFSVAGGFAFDGFGCGFGWGFCGGFAAAFFAAGFGVGFGAGFFAAAFGFGAGFFTAFGDDFFAAAFFS